MPGAVRCPPEPAQATPGYGAGREATGSVRKSGGGGARRGRWRLAFPGQPSSARVRVRALPSFPPLPSPSRQPELCAAAVRGAGGAALRGGYGGGAELPACDFGPAMWCLHCSSERTQSLLELELDSW